MHQPAIVGNNQVAAIHERACFTERKLADAVQNFGAGGNIESCRDISIMLVAKKDYLILTFFDQIIDHRRKTFGCPALGWMLRSWYNSNDRMFIFLPKVPVFLPDLAFNFRMNIKIQSLVIIFDSINFHAVDVFLISRNNLF